MRVYLLRSLIVRWALDLLDLIQIHWKKKNLITIDTNTSQRERENRIVFYKSLLRTYFTIVFLVLIL